MHTSPEESRGPLRAALWLLAGAGLLGVGLVAGWVTLYGTTRAVAATGRPSIDLGLYGVPAALALGGGARLALYGALDLLSRRPPSQAPPRPLVRWVTLAPGLVLLALVLSLWAFA